MKLDEIKIDQNYRELIDKLNSHLSFLTKEMNKSQKDTSFFENISNAFKNETDITKLTDKYTEFLNQYFDSLRNLKSKYENIKNDASKENVFASLEQEFIEFESLKTAFESYKSFYLYSHKEQLLDLNKQLILEESVERYEKLMIEYEKTLEQIKLISEKPLYSQFTLLNDDLKSIKQLPTKLRKIKIKNFWTKFILISLLLCGIVGVALSIWLLII